MSAVYFEAFLMALLVCFFAVFSSGCAAPKSLQSQGAGDNAILGACSVSVPASSHSNYLFSDNNQPCLLKTLNTVDMTKPNLSIYDPSYFVQVDDFLINHYVYNASDFAIIDICYRDAQLGTDIDNFKSQISNIIQSTQSVGMSVFVANCHNPSEAAYSNAIASVVSTLHLTRVTLLETFLK